MKSELAFPGDGQFDAIFGVGTHKGHAHQDPTPVCSSGGTKPAAKAVEPGRLRIIERPFTR